MQLPAPDITPYRASNTGTDWVHRLDSGQPGPVAMVSGLVHGNELCGAIVLDRLLREGFRPVRGSVLLVFANPGAYAAFDPVDPVASRFLDEDMNRIWSDRLLDDDTSSRERRRARELRPYLASTDLLLDLHSMQADTAPMLLAGSLDKGRVLAGRVGFPLLVVCDRGHAAGPRMRDYGPFADPASPQAALLLEAGQHWTAGTDEVAWEATLRFLLVHGMAGRDQVEARLGHAAAAQRLIEVTEAVTVASDAFRFTGVFVGMEEIPRAGTLVAIDGDRPVTTPHDHCLMIMPSRRPAKGQTAVRFGRYIG